jgi:hypothetical protein
MKYSLIYFLLFAYTFLPVFSQDKIIIANDGIDSVKTHIYTSEEIERIFKTLRNDYVLYETFNKKDTLGIINKFIDEIATYVPVSDSLKCLLQIGFLNTVRHDPGKFTIDDLGYLKYRNELRLSKSHMIYKVIYRYFNTTEALTIMQEIKAKSKLIDSFIKSMVQMFPHLNKDKELIFSEKYRRKIVNMVFASDKCLQKQKSNVADTVKPDTVIEQEAIRVIRDFYQVYTMNILSGISSNDLFVKKHLTKRLIEKIDRIRTATGADPVIRAQDFRKDVIETLSVRHLVNNWYMIAYAWDRRHTDIPLRVTQTNGQYMIDYITPEWNGSLYGDSLLFDNPAPQKVDDSTPLCLLKTFYAAYRW